MYTVEIAQIKTNENNEAVVYRMPTSRKSHFLAFEDTISNIKQLIEKEAPPSLTFFKIHGNGSLAYADEFGNPLPIKDWDKFSSALCEAKGWVFAPDKMTF